MNGLGELNWQIKVNILCHQTKTIVKQCASLVCLKESIKDLKSDCDYLIQHMPPKLLFHYVEWFANVLVFIFQELEHLSTGRINEKEHENEIRNCGWLLFSNDVNNGAIIRSIMSVHNHKSEVLKLLDILSSDTEGTSNFRSMMVAKILTMEVDMSEVTTQLEKTSREICTIARECQFWVVRNISPLKLFVRNDAVKGIQECVFDQEYFQLHERYNRQFTRQHLLGGQIPDPKDCVGCTKECLLCMQKDLEAALQFSWKAACVLFKREESILKSQKQRLCIAYQNETDLKKRPRGEDI
jgi:hypothetical protein